jgi:hypothetical protein
MLVAGACGGSKKAIPAVSSSSGQLVATVASYDLAVGKQRFLVGLLTNEQKLIGGGGVTMNFVYLGTKENPQNTGKVAFDAPGTFLPIPREGGAPFQPAPQPTVVPAAEGSGVYAAQADFDKPGYWGVVVEAKVAGKAEAAKATFEVLDKHHFPAVGEPAPKTQNLTTASKDVPPAAIDSRAQGGAPLPDPELHSTTVAQSIDAHKPVLLVVSTPVYCISRFCGPITDMVAGLAKTYANRANFIHIEVWEDFQNGKVNPSAAEWVLRDGNVEEPWVFLIGADGKIAARWDNVSTAGEIEPLLRSLPAG